MDDGTLLGRRPGPGCAVAGKGAVRTMRPRSIVASICLVGAALLARPMPAGTVATSSVAALPIVVAQAPNSWSAELQWSAMPGALRYRIFRDGKLIYQVPSDEDRTYTDYLLWPSVRYRYQVIGLGERFRWVGSASTTVVTPRLVDRFPRFYSSTSFWNIPIGSSPRLDPKSQDMVLTSLAAYRRLGVINNDDAWGIPLAYASPHSTLYTIGCEKYGCGTDVRFRIPRYARPNTGSDGHLAVYDPSTRRELDFWQGAYDARTRTWSAGSRTVTDADWGAVCPSDQRCGGGGTAAGFLEFAGVIRPEEILQGHIDHALVLSTPYVRRDFIACPATNYWASQGAGYKDDPKAIPLGAHVQLDPSFDVAARPWPRWKKVVARALQKYGAYIADVSGTLELRGEANLTRGYDAWARVGMITSPHPSLRDLPWKRFRVLSVKSC